eukprot:m.92419 g.92419  ORF g.92419 m.92419 type:complete len:567 (+) comp8891_c0_seq3:59-1759(+)
MVVVAVESDVDSDVDVDDSNNDNNNDNSGDNNNDSNNDSNNDMCNNKCNDYECNGVGGKEKMFVIGDSESEGLVDYAIGVEDVQQTPKKWPIYLVSSAFLLLFLAYNTLQNYATSLLPGDLGSNSLAILYLVVPFSCFFGPVFLDKLGEKWSMVIGGACYIVFMASMIVADKAPWAVLASSVIIGFGSAILWVGIGSYLTKASTPDTLGSNNGIFWGIFQTSNVLGNLGAYFIFNHLGGSNGLFIALTGAGCCGVLLLMCVRQTKHFEHTTNLKAARSKEPPHNTILIAAAVNEGDDESQPLLTPTPTPAISISKQIWKDILDTFDIMGRNEILALIYMFFFSGFELAYWSGEVPQTICPSSIGIVMVFAGVGEIIGSIFANLTSDKFGCTMVLLISACCYAGGLLGTTFLHLRPDVYRPEWNSASWLIYVCTFLLGYGDAGINTQIYALIGKMSRDEGNMVKAFTVFQIWQNIGSAVGYFYGPYLPMHGVPSPGLYDDDDDDDGGGGSGLDDCSWEANKWRQGGGSLGQIYVQGVILFAATVLFIRMDRKSSLMKRNQSKPPENL